MFNYMTRPQTVFGPHRKPQNSPLGPKKKSKMTPEIKSKLKVRIEGNIENKSCSTT